MRVLVLVLLAGLWEVLGVAVGVLVGLLVVLTFVPVVVVVGVGVVCVSMMWSSRETSPHIRSQSSLVKPTPAPIQKYRRKTIPPA